MISLKQTNKQTDFNIGLYADIYRQISFKVSVIVEAHQKALHFDISLDGLDLHSRL